MNRTIQRTILVAFVSLFITKHVKSQQINLFSHSFYSPIIYNPAFTGHKGTTNITLVSKEQWTGFQNSPTLNVLTIDASILEEKMGLGAIIFSNSKGINKTVGGNLLYSYAATLNSSSKLKFGLSVNFISHSINLSNAIVQDISDPTIFTSKQSQTNFDGNIGVAYLWNNLEVGLSAIQIIRNKSAFFKESGRDISYTPAMHFVNSIKYTYTLNTEKQTLIVPQVLIRYVSNAPIQYEINTNAYFNNKFWVGAAYKNNYAISINAGINVFKKLDVGYSFDIITSDIGQQAGMSHELMLNFIFGNQEKEEKEKRKKKEKVRKEKEKEKKKENEENEVEDRSIKETESEIEDDKETSDTPKEKKENEVIVLTAPAKEFIDANKKEAKPGAYVVVGSFVFDDYAIKYVEKIKQKGYPQADRFYSEKRNYNYVYMFKESSLDNALKKVKEAQENGSSQAWIIILTE